MNAKQLILDNVEDLMTDFLVYDRKEDENLPRGVIQAEIAKGTVTIDEICAIVRKRLEAGQ